MAVNDQDQPAAGPMVIGGVVAVGTAVAVKAASPANSVYTFTTGYTYHWRNGPLSFRRGMQLRARSAAQGGAADGRRTDDGDLTWQSAAHSRSGRHGTAVVAAGTKLAGGGEAVLVYNASAAVAFVRFGTDLTVVATSADMPVPPGGRMLMHAGEYALTAAVLLSSGSGTVYFSRGNGTVY